MKAALFYAVIVVAALLVGITVGAITYQMVMDFERALLPL